MKQNRKIVVRPLIISICTIVFLQILNRVVPPLLDPTAGEVVGFMMMFGTIMLGGAFFLAFVAANVNGKVPRRLHSIVELIIIFFIVVGLVSMFQPISLEIYSTGFNVLMFALLAFIVWSHLVPKLPSQEAEEMAEKEAAASKGEQHA
jgi:F0F1-type ATP synthase membrane subunit a